MIESYIDFVYLTLGGIPVAVIPSDYADNMAGGYKVISKAHNIAAVGKRRRSFHCGDDHRN